MPVSGERGVIYRPRPNVKQELGGAFHLNTQPVGAVGGASRLRSPKAPVKFILETAQMPQNLYGDDSVSSKKDEGS